MRFRFLHRCIILLIAILFIAACDDSTVEPEPIIEVDPVVWLTENSIPVESIDPDNENFSDLAPLIDVLSGCDVVMLGEVSHGDGAAFLAKARLIKFLHQEMGFDVLAFESGLFDCRKSWRQLLAGYAPHEAFSKGVFGIWASSTQVQPVIDYLGTQRFTARPLELAGVDCQFQENAGTYLVSGLQFYLNSVGSILAQSTEWLALRQMFRDLTENKYYSWPPPLPEVQGRFFTLLAQVDDELSSVAEDPDPRETSFWRQVASNCDTQAQRMWSMDWENYEDNPDSLLNLRDLKMGENLLWLTENYYPGRKIIVWAATFHNVHNLHTIEVPAMPGLYDGLTTMGHVVGEALGDRVYCLGFTASKGQFGTVYGAPENLWPPQEGSLEDLLSQTEQPLLIVDFRHRPATGSWLSQPLTARPLGYLDMTADWTTIMDGIFHIEVMTPSTRFVFAIASGSEGPGLARGFGP